MLDIIDIFCSTRGPLYDAICCDPLYGIRAGARQTGARSKTSIHPLTEEERKDHILQTKPHAVSDVMADLLDMAAQMLVLHGRLVYIIPSYTDFDPESDFPRHPCWQTLYISYEPLSMESGRRLVVMEKNKRTTRHGKRSIAVMFGRMVRRPQKTLWQSWTRLTKQPEKSQDIKKNSRIASRSVSKTKK